VSDPVYNNLLFGKFISKMMFKGKRSLSERIFYNALALVEKKIKKEPLVIFDQAFKNVVPLMAVKPRRVGGATYQVPIELPTDKANSMAVKWLIDAARARRGISMTEKLAAEFIDAYNNTGTAVKKREDTHKMAEANKAFAHFRW
jgi:small subunit ribosomal protein S7